MIPHPDKPGYLKYDSSRWIPDPDNPGETKYNSDPNFVTDYEKLLREESQKRKEVMRQVIKSRGIEIDNSFLEEEPKPEAESKPSRQSQKRQQGSHIRNY